MNINKLSTLSNFYNELNDLVSYYKQNFENNDNNMEFIYNNFNNNILLSEEIGLNIKKQTGGNHKVKRVILHYANWCGHCNQFKPEWEKIKNYCNNNNNILSYYEVDHTNGNPIISPPIIDDNDNNNNINIPFDIDGFPTIYLYNNNEYKIYNGQRNMNSILDSLKIIIKN